MSHSHTSPLATFASVALVALTAGFALRDVRRWLGSMGSSSGDEPEQNLQVGGMTCGGCVQKLTTRLMAVEGVTHVQVDLPTGGVVVRGQALEPDRLWQAVTSVGFHAMEQEGRG